MILVLNFACIHLSVTKMQVVVTAHGGPHKLGPQASQQRTVQTCKHTVCLAATLSGARSLLRQLKLKVLWRVMHVKGRTVPCPLHDSEWMPSRAETYMYHVFVSVCVCVFSSCTCPAYPRKVTQKGLETTCTMWRVCVYVAKCGGCACPMWNFCWYCTGFKTAQMQWVLHKTVAALYTQQSECVIWSPMCDRQCWEFPPGPSTDSSTWDITITLAKLMSQS